MTHPDGETMWTDLGSTPHSIRFVDAGGWRTRLLEAGSGDETLLLLPGTGGHLEAYTRNIAAFANHFRVIAYDYPGHGYSAVTEKDLEIADYIEHLLELMSVLGIERAHIAGESLGGWIAAKFAARYPHRVDRIVLNTPGGTMARPEVMARIRELSQAAADGPTFERVQARLEWLMADPSSVTDELVQVRKAIYSRPGFSKSMSHILCLQDPDVRQRNLIEDDELRSITAPALVVWTSDDPSGPAGAGIRMAELIPGGRFELITEAGHWPQWEQPERFNALLLEFLGASGRTDGTGS